MSDNDRIPDLLVETFDTVRAAIRIMCPDPECHGGLDTSRRAAPDDFDGPMLCPTCYGLEDVSALTTLTLGEVAPIPSRVSVDTDDGWEPVTVGLVLGAWDAVAAARIEADTGWRAFVTPTTQSEVVTVRPPDSLAVASVILPVGRVVATATVTDVVEVRVVWRWLLTGVDLVTEPYDPPSDVPVVGAR